MLDHLASANPVSLCVPMACEKDMDEMQYIISGVASVVDSDGRLLTRLSGF
uniref:Glutaminase n=1 Tax=Mesocestoides corti TaxID=53468 RepID=A0A5K3FR05_MESCO